MRIVSLISGPVFILQPKKNTILLSTGFILPTVNWVGIKKPRSTCPYVVPPQMDYGYSMCVKLYKGLVKPEEFIDEEKMAKVVLPRENRVLL